MAKDLYGLTDSGIAPELQAEYRGLTRKQAIEEAMLQQAMKPNRGLIDAGRYKVAPSALEGLGQMANVWAAKRSLDEGDKKFADLGDRQRQLQSDAVQQYQRTAQDRTMSVPNVGAMTGSMDSQDVPRQNETVKGDPRKAIVELLSKPYVPAGMQQLAMGDYTRQRDQEYEAAQSAALMKAFGVGQPTVTQGPPTAQIMPMPNTGQEGGPQTSFAGPRTDILAQLNSIKDPQEKAAALQAFQSQDMSQRGMQTTQSPANAAVTAALMPGKAAARIAPLLAAQQKQVADLADKAAGRAETGDLRRELAGQTDLTRRELAGQNEQLRRDIAEQSSADRRAIADQRTNAVGKPIPAPALKMQQEDLDAIGTAKAISADMGAISKQIDTGKLPLGVINNAVAGIKNWTGNSTEETRNLATFKANLEKLRNDSLRLNKGVQTEGDAVRAWNEMIVNINDPALVKQRIAEIQALNDRAVTLRKLNIDNIRKNYGHEPLDTSGYENQPAAVNLPKGYDSEKERRYQEWKASQGK